MKLLEKILGAQWEPAGKEAGIQDVIENLRLLSKGEEEIAEFYELCGDVLTDEREFWHGLATSERVHAETALSMAALIEKDPGKYSPGRYISVELVRLFRLHVQGLAKRMREGKIRKDELLSVAADIENSVLEMNYGGLVETSVPEYHAMVCLLKEETEGHRLELETRMMAVP